MDIFRVVVLGIRHRIILRPVSNKYASRCIFLGKERIGDAHFIEISIGCKRY